MSSSSRVSDSTSKFSGSALSSEVVALAKLIDTVLGARLGTMLLQQVGGDCASPTALYSYLRSSLNSSSELLGLDPKRMAKLQAALELGRLLCYPSPKQGVTVDDPTLAAQVLQAKIGYEPVEKMAVLVLDIKHRLIAGEIIASGTVSECLAHPREIFRAVILNNGSRCIIAHNHPSGSVDPSPEDLTLTKQLLRAAQSMAIPILDHIVVSHGQFCSIRQTTDLWAEVPQGDS